MRYYLGIDLGGTNIVAAVLNENYTIISRASKKTACPRPAEAIMDDMAIVAETAAEKAEITLSDVEYVGIGCPGTVNHETGAIEYSNNLEFYDVPMGEYMEKRLKCPVLLDNDANAAAYGEFLAGAAKGTNNFVAITLGTGVGSGIIIDRKLYHGSNDAGGELGHMVVQVGGRPCTCGRKGCLESYASATGLITSTKESLKNNKDSVMWELIKGDLSAVDGRTAFDGMRKGDAAAQAVVTQYIESLAAGITNVINIFQPDLVSLAGGISKEGDTLLTPLRAIVEKEDYARYGKKRTKIAIAQLDNDAGVIGAALLGVKA